MKSRKWFTHVPHRTGSVQTCTVVVHHHETRLITALITKVVSRLSHRREKQSRHTIDVRSKVVSRLPIDVRNKEALSALIGLHKRENHTQEKAFFFFKASKL
jgi:hypothetical protein